MMLKFIGRNLYWIVIIAMVAGAWYYDNWSPYAQQCAAAGGKHVSGGCYRMVPVKID